MTESFRDFEHTGWADPTVCARYDDLLSSLTTQSIAPMLDAAGVKTGSVVLDVATGAGYAAGASLARGAQVTGTDFSAEQVRLAKQRFPAAGFVEADAGSLPFASVTFDAVVANYGVLHFPEPDRFFREAFRVLKSGGRLAFTVWDTPQQAKLFGAVLAAVNAHGSMDVGLPGGPNMFLFADAATSEAAHGLGGLQGCRGHPGAADLAAFIERADPAHRQDWHRAHARHPAAPASRGAGCDRRRDPRDAGAFPERAVRL